MPRHLETTAVRLLAMREYARRELAEKLQQRGYQRDEVETLLDGLEQQGLLSDERFAEGFVRRRRERGLGPRRIRVELEGHGVSEALIEAQLPAENAAEWLPALRRVHEKKFGQSLPSGQAELAKRTRFLQFRGFTWDQIQQLFSQD